MAPRPRARKRVFAIRRAPDGSAFQKCGICGVSVAIALADIHDCEHKMEAKRFKGTCGMQRPPRSQPTSWDHPASPFRLFMETFKKAHEMETLYEVERMGFEEWHKMTDAEKYPYFFKAKLVDRYHQDELDRESEEIIKVDDEADSARDVKKADKTKVNTDGSTDSKPENPICGSDI